VKRIGFRLAALALAAIPAFASGIVYDCDTTDSNKIGSSVCTTLQTTIAGQYASIFSNANALIYIQYGSIGGVAQNTQVYNTVSYSTYYSKLLSGESGTADVTAVGSLGGGTTNPVVAADGVAVTSALDAALGLSGALGINSSGGSCSGIGLGTTVADSCFNDIITVSNTWGLYYDVGQYQPGQYDFFTAVEHETDEALGTASCLQEVSGIPLVSGGCGNGGPGVSAADLFRYSATGVRSFLGPGGNQATGSLAYFSINSGATDLAPYNNTPNTGDYGDWSTYCKYVQDAFGCSNSSGNLTIQNDGGAEIAVLDAVGYNLTAQGKSLSEAYAPEPGTIGLLAVGLGMLAGFARRRSE
jgi:hypothetical protein